VQSWAEFARAVKAGVSAGRVAGTVVARTERRTRTGSKMGIIGLSDPSGAYEAVLFSEGLAQFRDLLEPGKAVLLQLSAELQGDDVRARIQMVEPLDQAAAKLQKGLRVFLRNEAPIESVAKRLEGMPNGSNGRATPERSEGEVSMVLMLGEGTEVEVKLPGRFKVSPQIAGAIKAVPGVVAVEAL
jgi:DNA polymerase III subunit alpha